MVASASVALVHLYRRGEVHAGEHVAVDHDERLAVEVLFGVLDAARGTQGVVLYRVIHGEAVEVLLFAEVGLDRVWQVPQGEHRPRKPAAAQEVQHVAHEGTVA